ncbi:4Fe-4S ferredoxin [Anaerosporomusa subterranea]|uniref:4Fe-4S ferredoxin n=1 Tax=Anaerosporomusa subterranea TaxID=1794912 RepID=A0A154BPS2_ANASB|nr:4Fe-4S binding protein [Anaerosporomusa subterranea]KYZ75860.1 4Fe-4S ferredoxin [Anaerosporomusa subterranea]MDF2499565.1 Ferredoxin [Anaerosporomusa subterranea]
MSLKIHANRCKGCGICVEFCPKKVLAVSQLEKVEVVKEKDCIMCRQCEMRCPDFAIFVHKE